jgi:glycosyltransferase involved in cell wall biosynthesis
LSGQLLVFGTSEYQQLNGLIFNDGLSDGLRNSNLKIITPSNWSKIGFINSGFDERRVYVIPHGVADVYRPLSQDEAENYRRHLGCLDEEFVILSMGSMTWNKGIDILILAYSILKIKYPHIRLILKDSSNLYGISAKDIFYQVKELNPNLLSDAIFQSIIFISDNLTQAQLNSLYGSSDCYVSPYRAEGFNLSPLEAAASGTPILVTEGGSTDDYFDESLGAKIEGRLCSYSGGGHYIEPSLESLVQQLTAMIESKNIKLSNSLGSDPKKLFLDCCCKAA